MSKARVDLAELVRIMEGATAGPWQWAHGRLFFNAPDHYYSVTVLQITDERWTPIYSDARLISLAPIIGRAYIDQAKVIDGLTADRDRLREALNEFIAALNAGKTTAWDNDGGLTLDRYENAYRNLRDALKEG